MSRTPRFHTRTGLSALGLVLLAVALMGGAACFFLLGKPAERGTRAAERKHEPVAEAPVAVDDGRAAPQVELVPAGIELAPAAAPAPVAELQAAPAAPQALALDAGTSEPLEIAATEAKVEGPELKHVREGKTEIVKGREVRRERRSDRREREAEAAALGVPQEKRAVESPKKNASRSQVKKVESKDVPPPRRSKSAPREKEEAAGG